MIRQVDVEPEEAEKTWLHEYPERPDRQDNIETSPVDLSTQQRDQLKSASPTDVPNQDFDAAETSAMNVRRPAFTNDQITQPRASSADIARPNFDLESVRESSSDIARPRGSSSDIARSDLDLKTIRQSSSDIARPRGSSADIARPRSELEIETVRQSSADIARPRGSSVDVPRPEFGYDPDDGPTDLVDHKLGTEIRPALRSEPLKPFVRSTDVPEVTAPMIQTSSPASEVVESRKTAIRLLILMAAVAISLMALAAIVIVMIG